MAANCRCASGTGSACAILDDRDEAVGAVLALDHSHARVGQVESDEIRNGIKSYSNWPTIPQLYVKGEFVGGCDIIREMFQAGELQQALKEKGVSVRQTA